MSESMIERLLHWYEDYGRDLPWRGSRDPYVIWVSEVMLQQTRVEAVLPYFRRWMERFPSIQELAQAESDQVLHLWEGLGYYRRAHNMLRAAQVIVEDYGGSFPREPRELEELPGVGPYTAAAIAAIAYGVPVVALDGNLRRVLSRLFDVNLDPRSTQGERELLQWGNAVLPKDSASSFNQALMDLGATLCSPRKPDCQECPLVSDCLAFERGVQEERPVRSAPKSIPHYTVAAGVLRRGSKYLIARRPEGKLLGGLWEFPGGKCRPDESLEECLQREWREELGVEVEPGRSLGVYSHAYTHFKVTVHALACKLIGDEPHPFEHMDIRWVQSHELGAFPMGKVDRMIAEEIVEAG